ncbi:MAG: DNA polymerase/3'-5' exonuclease PolX [Nitriliruptorales bacterium]|nr:DNA polymerase/3'-5' exonuclease PolX [Nitriliruptorales bacterium]
MPRANDEVAGLLHELAVMTEIEEGSRQSFRARAYHNAVRAVKATNRDVTTMSFEELTSIKGIGKAIANKILEFAETGTMKKLEELRATYPRGQQELMQVPGLGPKTISLLYDVLGVSDVASLQEAIEAGKLRELPGLGEKTEENLKEALDRLELTSGERRTPIAQVLPLAREVVADLSEVDGVERVAYAGSLRRFRDTIRDIDVLVASASPSAVMEAFVGLPLVRDVQGRGDTKASVLTFDGMQIDLRVVPPERFGAALLYFTGSKEHNIRLRERALQRGWTLNEYALAELVEDDEGTASAGEEVAAETEEGIYAALDLAWIPPEMREDDGEIELAEGRDLPEFAEVADLRGDLHDHSNWSGDGKASMEAMIAGSRERGLDYLAFTDHAENLTINGLSRPAMLDQRRRLRELQEQTPDLHLLHGAELNIGIDGSLDYDAEFLAGFDWLVASVHSHFRRPADEQTARVIAAIRHPSVTAIGHLTGRRVGKRPGIELDVGAVLDAAAETGVAIEINCNLDRLDAPAEIVREGARRGVTFVISTDAHSVRELDYAVNGIRQARRGWLPKDQIANTRDIESFLQWVDDVRAAK